MNAASIKKIELRIVQNTTKLIFSLFIETKHQYFITLPIRKLGAIGKC